MAVLGAGEFCNDAAYYSSEREFFQSTYADIPWPAAGTDYGLGQVLAVAQALRGTRADDTYSWRLRGWRRLGRAVSLTLATAEGLAPLVDSTLAAYHSVALSQISLADKLMVFICGAVEDIDSERVVDGSARWFLRKRNFQAGDVVWVVDELAGNADPDCRYMGSQYDHVVTVGGMEITLYDEDMRVLKVERVAWDEVGTIPDVHSRCGMREEGALGATCCSIRCRSRCC